MITSIVLTGKHVIELDAYNKFKHGKNRTSIKEVPFIRYRFDRYGQDEIEYIRDMKEKWIYSSHLVEIHLDEDTEQVIEDLDKVDNLIKYVYMEIDDSDIDNGLSDEKIRRLESIAYQYIDRFMLKDKSTKLDIMRANELKSEIASILDIDEWDVGICQSPLSFGDGNACLTALKARELSAEYAENDEAALPTANHQSMKTCGCIRYITIDSDIKIERKKSTANKGKKKAKRRAKSRGIPMWR